MTGLDPVFTASVRQRVCEALRIGATYEEAAQYACVRYRLLRRCVKRGKRAYRDKEKQQGTLDPVEDASLLAFYDEMEQARGYSIVYLLAKIEKGANKDWKAAVWKLQRLLSFYPGSKSGGRKGKLFFSKKEGK